MAAFVIPSGFVGCDVGKSEIVVHDATSLKTSKVANTPKALAAFAAKLDPHCLVVCEATGGYEGELLDALLAKGIPAHRADAAKVKAFIRSFGVLGKTDEIDAKALARYGQERHADLPRWRAPDRERVKLQALVLARRDLVVARGAFHNRSKAPGCLTKVHADMVKAFDKNILKLDVEIAALLTCVEPLARAAKVLTQIKGVGAKSAAVLVALLPELGHLDRRAIASLAGLAPHPRQSGASNAYRSTRGGRAEVKRALFMPALVAARLNPDLKPYFQRLVQNGKKRIVAITAVMRKLIVIANARIRDAISSTPLAQVS